MMCGSIYVDALGALLIALGLLGMISGFFRGLTNTAAREGGALLLFVLGMAATALGAWLMQAC